MLLSTKLELLGLYGVAILLTVYLWDNRRRFDAFKYFMPEQQLIANVHGFRFVAPIALTVAGVYLISLFAQ